MKAQSSCICLLLVFAAITGACYGEASPNAVAMPPGANIPATVTPAPAAAGAGPAAAGGAAGEATCPCPTGRAGTYFIPGFETSTCTVTTYTPVPDPCAPVTGAGPATCPPPCPPSPSVIVKCTPNCPTYCEPCPEAKAGYCDPCTGKWVQPQPTCTTTCTTSTCAAGPGAGPCAYQPVAAVSASTQTLLDCINGLSGVDADKAFLQAIITLNSQILALSDASAGYFGSTSLSDWGINSIADARSNMAKARKWLATKYCVVTTTCVPLVSASLDICDIRARGRDFDEAYKAQAVQYYVDEMALAQAVIARGLDCEVKAWAAKIIRDDQKRIQILYRCNTCF